MVARRPQGLALLPGPPPPRAGALRGAGNPPPPPHLKPRSSSGFVADDPYDRRALGGRFNPTLRALCTSAAAGRVSLRCGLD